MKRLIILPLMALALLPASAQKLIVTTMESDNQGNILFASKDSLFMIRDGQIENLCLPELTGHEVRSLHISPKGYLVVAVIDGLFVSRISQDYTISDTRFFDHTTHQLRTDAFSKDGSFIKSVKSGKKAKKTKKTKKTKKVLRGRRTRRER